MSARDNAVQSLVNGGYGKRQAEEILSFVCGEAREQGFQAGRSAARAEVLNEAADEVDTSATQMERVLGRRLETSSVERGVANRLRRMATAAPAAATVPVKTAADETGEAYPGELAHLRDLLRDVGRLADKQPKGNPLTELLIDHYSDSRMVDAQLAKGGDR